MTGKELLEIRESLGVTQAQFARLLGRHSNTIARYERDEIPIPRVVELAILAMKPRGKKARMTAEA